MALGCPFHELSNETTVWVHEHGLGRRYAALPNKQSTGGKGGGGNSHSVPESILDDEQSVLTFCGKNWDDAISTFLRPCPSGLSDDCDEAETFFAGTSCGAGGVIAAGDTCKICPDTTTQGILLWVKNEVKLDGVGASSSGQDLDFKIRFGGKKCNHRMFLDFLMVSAISPM